MKVLIVAPNWVGDLVIAQGLMRLLKQNNPEVVIHVLVRGKLSSLLERMPEVDKILLAPTVSGKLQLKSQYFFARSLRAEKYDQAIVLPNSFKSALLPFLAKIPKRTGWRGEMRYLLLNDLRVGVAKFPSLVQRFLFLGLASESRNLAPEDAKRVFMHEQYLPQLRTTAENIETALQRLHLSRPRRLLAICPGAEYGPAKRWPVEYFAELIKTVAPHWDVWLLGSERDRVITDEIQKLSGNLGVNLAGKTNLAEVVDLLSLAAVVITNDSGLMHIAAALDKPLIAIYGSSSPQFTPPLTDKAQIVTLNLPCSPCFQRTCPLGHLRCLRDLTPEVIVKIVRDNFSNENLSH